MARSPMLLPKRYRGADISRLADTTAANRETALAAMASMKLRRFHNWTKTDAEEALAQLVQHADVVGLNNEAFEGAPYGDPGVFLLIAVSPELAEWLAAFGPDVDDERDDDDQCVAHDDDMEFFTNGMMLGLGDVDDAEDDDPREEDDHPGGNITDEPHDQTGGAEDEEYDYRRAPKTMPRDHLTGRMSPLRAGLDAGVQIVPPHERPARKMGALFPWEMPDQYSLVTCGVCMEPEIIDGTRVLVSSVEACWPGDLVVLWLRPEAVPPGEHQMLCKRLIVPPPAGMALPCDDTTRSDYGAAVIVEMLNPAKRLAIPCRNLLGIHKVLGPLPAHYIPVRKSDEELRQAGIKDRRRR